MKYHDAIASLISPSAFESYASSDVGDQPIRAALQGLTIEDLFVGGYEDADMASCCLSGLWLLHNFLEEGHEICQGIDTPEGSHWHAIMHRAEGDFSNAKYWYRRAQTDWLHAEISKVSGQPFDPVALVDAVAQGFTQKLHDLKVAEWQVLFDHCYTQAQGGGMLE